MCLGIPGEVLTVEEGPLPVGQVAFGPVTRQVCLACVPDARVGDFVLVHAGLALSRIDAEAAARILAELDRLGEGA